MKPAFSREQKTTIVNGILCLVLMLTILQLWLLTGTMNAFLSGEVTTIWPSAFASLACFGLNLGLLRFIYANERDRR